MNNKDWTDALKDRMESYVETPSDRAWAGVSEKLTSGKRTVFPVWLRAAMGIAAALTAVTLITVGITGRQPDRLAENTIEVSSAGRMPEEGGVPAGAAKMPDSRDEETDVAPAADYFPSEVTSPEAPVTKRSVRRSAEAASLTGERTAASGIASDISSDAAAAEDGSAAGTRAEGILTAETTVEVPASSLDPASGESVTAEKSAAAKMPSEAVSDSDKEADNAVWAELMKEDETQHRGGHLSLGLSASGAGRSAGSESRDAKFVMGSNPLADGSTNGAWVSPEFDEKSPTISALDYPSVNTEYNHHIPIRFGVAARYEIAKGLGAESGLTYSILTSDMLTGEKGTDKSYIEHTQTLHYIGIPLNLSYNLLDTKRLTVYVSGGGMAEKCISGRIRSKEYSSGQYLRTSSGSTTPKELQWSVNAAAGVQVNVFDRLGLYVEPGISRRLHSGSHIRSAYTDKPTDFTVSFGLRLSFK